MGASKRDSSRRQNGRWLHWLVGFVVWTAAVFVAAGECYVRGELAGVENVSFLHSLSWAVPVCYGWALLTPVVFWLVRRLRLERGRWRGRLAALLLAGTTVAALKLVLDASFYTVVLRDRPWKSMARGEDLLLMLRQVPAYLAVFAAITVVWYGLEHSRGSRARELREARLEAQLAVTRLQALRLQLHPHFVLNTLNTISAMIDRDPERAEEMIARIGELLRMALEDPESNLVPVSTEVAFLEKYLEIQQVRFGEQLDVRIEVEPSVGDAAVPSLLLQPFVENAIKHRSGQPGVSTTILIRIWRESASLRLRVEDNGPGLAPGLSPGLSDTALRPPTGLGIANSRARLDSLFGEGYELVFSSVEPTGLRVDLTLPFLSRGRTPATAAWPAA